MNSNINNINCLSICINYIKLILILFSFDVVEYLVTHISTFYFLTIQSQP